MFSVRIHIFARLRDKCPAFHWGMQSTRKRFSGALGVKSKERAAKTRSGGASSAPFSSCEVGEPHQLHKFRSFGFYCYTEDQHFRGKKNSRHCKYHWKMSILTFRGVGTRWSFRSPPTQTILFPVVRMGLRFLWFISLVPQNPVISCKKTELSFPLITGQNRNS